MVKAAEFARRELEVQWHIREKNCANQSRLTREIKVNQMVYVFDPAVKRGSSPKFARNWKGPYEVVEKISDLLYRVKLPGRKQ